MPPDQRPAVRLAIGRPAGLRETRLPERHHPQEPSLLGPAEAFEQGPLRPVEGLARAEGFPSVDVRQDGRGPLCCVAPGHDRHTIELPAYARLVGQAIARGARPTGGGAAGPAGAGRRVLGRNGGRPVARGRARTQNAGQAGMSRPRAPEPAGGTIDADQRATRRRLLIGAAAAAGALLAGRTGPAISSSTAATSARSRLLRPLAGGRPRAPRAAFLSGGITIVPLGPNATPTARPVSAAASPAGPTATPIALPPPERPPILRASKWGIGVYREGNTIFDDLYTSQPGVLLLMDPSEGWARRVRSTFPSAFVVGRRYLSEAAQPLDNPEARGAALADWVAELGHRLRGIVNAWVSYNEVTSHDDRQGYRLYNRLQVAFARRLQD